MPIGRLSEGRLRPARHAQEAVEVRVPPRPWKVLLLATVVPLQVSSWETVLMPVPVSGSLSTSKLST